MVLIEVVPEHFSVVGVIGSSISLFSSVIVDRHSFTSQIEHDHILDHFPVSIEMQESRIIMVISEHSQCSFVFELLHAFLHVLDIVETLSSGETVSESEVLRIVQ